MKTIMNVANSLITLNNYKCIRLDIQQNVMKDYCGYLYVTESTGKELTIRIYDNGEFTIC